MEKKKLERVGKKHIQDLNFNIVKYFFQKQTKIGFLEPTSLALQGWLNVSMEAFNLPSALSQIEAFNLPSKLLQICSQTTTKATQIPSKINENKQMRNRMSPIMFIKAN